MSFNPDYTYNSKEFLEKKIEKLHKEVAVLKNEQKLAEWSKETKECLDEAIELLENLGYAGEADNLKHLRPQPRGEIYQTAKHDLVIKFMNYLDENRPEGKMSLSNGECEDINKAFRENDWAKILRYIEKYGK